MRDWGVSEPICIRVEEAGKAGEDAINSGAGGGSGSR